MRTTISKVLFNVTVLCIAIILLITLPLGTMILDPVYACDTSKTFPSCIVKCTGTPIYVVVLPKHPHLLWCNRNTHEVFILWYVIQKFEHFLVVVTPFGVYVHFVILMQFSNTIKFVNQ